jgi:hypothetical protein
MNSIDVQYFSIVGIKNNLEALTCSLRKTIEKLLYLQSKNNELYTETKIITIGIDLLRI